MPHLRHTFTLIAVIALVGCSSPKPTPTQDNGAVYTQAFETALADLSTGTPQSTNTQIATMIPPATPTIEPSAILEWSIKTGELYLVGAASDGNLYGLTKSSYVIFSSQGQIISQSQLSDVRCRTAWTGDGYSVPHMHYLVRYDGTILCFSSPYSIIESGNPPKITPVSETVSWDTDYPYINDSQLLSYPANPPSLSNSAVFSGYTDWRHGGTYSFIANGDQREIYLSQQGFGFYDRNRNFYTIEYPSDFDVARLLDWAGGGIKPTLNGVFIRVTPWDDVYLKYPLYDALGNRTRDKVLRIRPTGEISEIQQLPEWEGVYYLPEKDEIYSYKQRSYDNRLYRLDKDLRIIATYKLPDEMPNGVYLFVGHDNAFYEWKDDTLKKYKLIGDNLPETITSSETPSSFSENQVLLTPTMLLTPSNAPNETSIICSNFTSQLHPGMEAKVVSDLGINMREKPGTNQTIVGIIYTDEKVTIYNEQPVCNEGFLWWKVQAANSGITGWAVEGTTEERWLLP